MWPPPLNFNAGCRATWAVTSPERLKYEHIFFKFLLFMENHSSIPAWRIPWTKEPGGLQSMGLQSRTWLSDWTTGPKTSPFQYFTKKKKAFPKLCVPVNFQFNQQCSKELVGKSGKASRKFTPGLQRTRFSQIEKISVNDLTKKIVECYKIDGSIYRLYGKCATLIL